MMNSIETAKQAIVVIQTLLPLVGSLLTLAREAKARFARPAVSYENLLLDVTLDLQDPGGRKAHVTCKQKVRFLVNDGGIITSPVWGEGNQIARYEVAGARRLGERGDGPRRVQLLGLEPMPRSNRQATIVAARRVQDAFTSDSEYFESGVERPTKEMRLTVLFPKKRPPRETYLVSSHGEKLSQPRLRLQDGRARLRWRLDSPKISSVYSLRWAW